MNKKKRGGKYKQRGNRSKVIWKSLLPFTYFFLFEFQIRQTSLVNDDYGYHGDRKYEDIYLPFYLFYF